MIGTCARRISSLATALALLAAVIIGTPVLAAELVMFEQRGCPWCQAFDREIASLYPKTPEGKQAPLRKVDIAEPLPDDLRFVVVERFTPVFVLVDRGREIGRIRGYAGEDHFWGSLSLLIKRLDAAPQHNSAARGSESRHSLSKE